MNRTFDFLAIGVVASELQTPVKRVRLIAAQLGIKPVGRINNVAHYASDDVEKIATHLFSGKSAASHRPEIKFVDLAGKTVLTKEVSQEVIDNLIVAANQGERISLTIGNRSFEIDTKNPLLMANRGRLVVRELDPAAEPFHLLEASEIKAQ